MIFLLGMNNIHIVFDTVTFWDNAKDKSGKKTQLCCVIRNAMGNVCGLFGHSSGFPAFCSFGALTYGEMAHIHAHEIGVHGRAQTCNAAAGQLLQSA